MIADGCMSWHPVSACIGQSSANRLANGLATCAVAARWRRRIEDAFGEVVGITSGTTPSALVTQPSRPTER